MRRHLVGFELDWLAVDAAGHIGLFSSGGYGPVPVAVVNHLGDVEEALKRLAVMPVTGECVEEPTGARFEFWIEPARRGFFGFDWGPGWEGPFTRLTVPSRPLKVADLVDRDFQTASALVQLSIEFNMATHVEASAIGDLDDGETNHDLRGSL